MMRIAFHSCDPQHASLEQKENIRELKEQVYTILSILYKSTYRINWIVGITPFFLLLSKA
jgi:hypothetical protein